MATKIAITAINGISVENWFVCVVCGVAAGCWVFVGEGEVELVG